MLCGRSSRQDTTMSLSLGIISHIGPIAFLRGGGSMKRFLAFWLFLPAAFAQVETTTSTRDTVTDQLGAAADSVRHAVYFLIQDR